MNRLSERQAGRCENATTARCKCRCGGAFHGAGRGPVVDLAPADPHYAVARRPRLFDPDPPNASGSAPNSPVQPPNGSRPMTTARRRATAQIATQPVGAYL